MRLTLLIVAIATLASPLQAQQPPGYDQLAAAQAAANGQPGPRHAPAHVDPVPTTEVSPQIQALIGNPYPPTFNADPKTPAEWKALVEMRVAPTIAAVPGMAEKLGVTYQATTIAGVKA